MTYRDYEGFKKTYVILHVTGTGVIEDKFIEHNIVFETDDKIEAEKKAKKLTIQNNSQDDIESTWYNNRYHININTLSKAGKELLEKFKIEFDERLNKGLKNGKYNKVESGGMTFYMDNRN